MTTQQRVQEGAMLLDEKRPGWIKEINLDSLNISSDYNCVLGQLYGYFGRGREELRLDTIASANRGFDRYGPADTWSGLNAAWKDYILAHRN